MNVVRVSVSPPVGPSSAPATVTLSQATAPGATKLGSEEESPSGFEGEGPCTLHQTVLASRECCQVTCILPLSSGLFRRSWVMTSLSALLNRLGCCVKRVNLNPVPDVTQ